MTATKPDVIIIRGAPGSGKSTLAKRLATHFPEGARIEVDSLRGMVISVDWTNQTEHKNILSLATNVVRDFHSRGYRPVIVVDTFSGDKLSKFLADLQQGDNSLDVRSYALVTAPDVLKLRIQKRPDDRFKDIDICQKLNSDVIKHLLPIEYLIDNTDLTPEETASIILAE